MEVNLKLREEFFGIIAKQCKLNDPPETKAALKRLKEMGYSDFESKQLICQCLEIEIFDTLKKGKPYNDKRYRKNLNNLPEEPVE